MAEGVAIWRCISASSRPGPIWLDRLVAGRVGARLFGASRKGKLRQGCELGAFAPGCVGGLGTGSLDSRKSVGLQA